MPGKLKVRIIAARNLPVMDRSSDLTDAFVEVKFGSETHKTEVVRKSLDPQWNSEWFRFEVDDEDLQDEPLQIKVLDHDTYSAHDTIGKLYIDLDPLLSKASASIISGWLPIYDTMHGIRGELNVVVKVDLFTDFNKFRQSSCGVQFFCTSGVPIGFRVTSMHGFVEELVVNDDPEYQWIDKIRSMRASNEARQLVFSKLTGELQRKIGLKVLEMGGNAVIGYRQCFDLEGESGIVVRAIGTSVALSKHSQGQAHSGSPHTCDSASPIRDIRFIYNSSFGLRSRVSDSTTKPMPRGRLVSCPIITLDPSHTLSLLPKTGKSRESKTSRHSAVQRLSFSGLSQLKVQTPGTKGGSDSEISHLGQDREESNSPRYSPEEHTHQTHLRKSTITSTSSHTSNTNDRAIEVQLNRKKILVISEDSSNESQDQNEKARLGITSYQQPGLTTEPAGWHPLTMSGPDCSTPLAEEGGPQHSPQPGHTPSTRGVSVSSPLKVDTSGGRTGAARRSSESDLSTPPKSSLTGSSGSGAGGSGLKSGMRPTLTNQNIDMLEYPFFTINSYPPGFIVHLGGVVSARSVKLLDKIHNPDEPETRDAWWTELRTEVRSHTRAMGCHAVIGYCEATSICEEIIILSAYGTAAIVSIEMRWGFTGLQQQVLNLSLVQAERVSVEREVEGKRERRVSGGGGPASNTQTPTLSTNTPSSTEQSNKRLHVDVQLANSISAQRAHRLSDSYEENAYNCSVFHIPYTESSLPFPVNLHKCALCRSKKVPDVLFSTIEPPPDVPLVGRGCLIQARICRPRKEGKGETQAKEISDSLPFMEYELHRQLLHKLKMKGMNTLFGMKLTFCVGEKLLVAVATATGVFTASLPPPPPLKLIGKGENGGSSTNLPELQKKVQDTFTSNIDLYGLYLPEVLAPQSPGPDDGEDETTHDVDFSAGNKDTFVLEVDDAEDADVVSVLLDPPLPDGFHTCNTEVMPGLPNIVYNLQTFTKVWRGQLSLTNNKAFSNVFNYILKGLYFKLRKLAPCALCHLDFDIDLPEEDQIQISITGTCAGVGDPQLHGQSLVGLANNTTTAAAGPTATGKENRPNRQDEDMMFDMEMATDSNAAVTRNTASERTRQPRQSPLLCKGLASMKEDRKTKYYIANKPKVGIELTPLSYVPGGRIENYMGHLNFFIVRETTSVRGEGGLNGFLHSFIAEVMAICRAHVSALGGNALVAYQMSECVLDDNIHKNQSQCLVNVYGDVVQVLYTTELQPVSENVRSTPRSALQTLGVSPKHSPRHSPRHSPKHSFTVVKS